MKESSDYNHNNPINRLISIHIDGAYKDGPPNIIEMIEKESERNIKAIKRSERSKEEKRLEIDKVTKNCNESKERFLALIKESKQNTVISK